jgi:hypothetical protein
MSRSPDRSVVIAVGALAVTGILFAAALVRAMTFQPAPLLAPPPQTLPSEGEMAGQPLVRTPSESRLTSDAIELAVDSDPFLEDRSRPEPYRMPGDRIELPPPEEPPPAEPPPFRLLGTVSWPDNGLALLQVEEESPRPIAVGESVMGFRLDRVDANGATMVRDDQTVRLAVAPPSPQGREVQASGRGRGRGNANQRAQAAREAAMSQMVERLRRSGAPTAAIEQLMEQMQGGRGNVQIEVGRDGSINVIRGRGNMDTTENRAPRMPGAP